jgi:hypothetical protein
MDAQQNIDALLGGLESALARGQPLQKAMASFYNAGYEKVEIEEAARKFQQIHQRRFAELGVEPEPKKKAVTAPVSEYSSKTPQESQKPIEPKLKVYRSELYSPENKKEEKKKGLFKKKEPSKKLPVVSRYGDDSVREAEDFKKALIEAISSIKTVPVSEGMPRQVKPVVINKIQKVSDYGMQAPTPVSKAITFLLIFLLILLLGLLGAVFFFKDELIELFNSLSIT